MRCPLLRGDDLLTERLRLVAMLPEMLGADEAGDGTLGALLGAAVPAGWPPEHWEPHVYAFLREQYAGAPGTTAWNRYLVLRGPEPVLVGTVNAFARAASEAEVGYSVLPAWQRRGLATEALRAFVGELLRDGSVREVTAQTFPWLVASVRVLEKCGFGWEGAGDEAGTVRFRLRRSGGCP